MRKILVPFAVLAAALIAVFVVMIAWSAFKLARMPTVVLDYNVSALDVGSREQLFEVWRQRVDSYGSRIVSIDEATGAVAVRIKSLDHGSERELHLLRELLEDSGELHFLIQAREIHFTGTDADLESEREAASTWIGVERGEDLGAYNRTIAGRDGVLGRLRWYLDSVDTEGDLQSRLVALMVEEDPAWRFGSADVDSVYPSSDDFGRLACGFELREDRQEAFEAFTGAHVDELLGIVVGDELLMLPNIQTPLPGKGIIQGGVKGFEPFEVMALLARLRNHSLPAVACEPGNLRFLGSGIDPE
ncbi:MAG: hypothetical protein GY711_27780 [bacterium]|nr:hypothetical protein [bacterium]